MPLIVMTGVPCSGKTTRAKELKAYFEAQGKEVHLISEFDEITKAGFDKNACFQDSNKEKHIRGCLKSEMMRLLRPDNLIILDGANYIKGYRYELYCASKSNKSTQCTIWTEINRKQAWDFNESRENEEEKYTREIFDALVMRYEDPHTNNRWDSPLFVTFPEAKLEIDEINASLFKTAPPPPNMSTQNPPLSSTNYLYDMNRKVKEITTSLVVLIQQNRKEIVKVPNYEQFEVNLKNTDIKKLISLSRQYLTYSKQHTPNVEEIPQLYIQYLISNLNE